MLHHNGIIPARSSIKAVETPDLVTRGDAQPSFNQISMTIERPVHQQGTPTVTPLQRPIAPTTPPPIPTIASSTTLVQPTISTPFSTPLCLNQQAFVTENVFSVPSLPRHLIPRCDLFDEFIDNEPYQDNSGVTKGPADPAVRGGAILGGRQIVV